MLTHPNNRMQDLLFYNQLIGCKVLIKYDNEFERLVHDRNVIHGNPVDLIRKKHMTLVQVKEIATKHTHTLQLNNISRQLTEDAIVLPFMPFFEASDKRRRVDDNVTSDNNRLNRGINKSLEIR